MELKFKNESPNEDPKYNYGTDSGFDLRAWIKDDEPYCAADPANDYKNLCGYKKGIIQLKPFERRLIHTGLYFDIPLGCEIQVRSRSGETLKKGLIALNAPGTVDCGYTGECCVILYNSTNEWVMVENGERIAQAVLCPVFTGGTVELTKVDDIKEKDRGANGFGSTGTK